MHTNKNTFLSVLASSAGLVMWSASPAHAITYTFNNAQFQPASGGTFTISGSFDYDGTFVTNFQQIEITRWLDSGAGERRPDLASYNSSTGFLGFIDTSPSNNNQNFRFDLTPPPDDGLTGSVQTISLTGKSGFVDWCNNNGCPGPQFNQESFQFLSGTLESVPVSPSALALAPLGVMIRLRKRYLKSND